MHVGIGIEDVSSLAELLISRFTGKGRKAEDFGVGVSVLSPMV